MNQLLEQLLAKHCGPVLMNIKPAAMISLPHAMRREALSIARMTCGCVKAVVLVRRAETDLCLFYRPCLLDRALGDVNARRILDEAGYPQEANAGRMIAHLKRRFLESGDFPHEAGLFLGYPAEDVAGFIEHRGLNYKLVGDWKVYGDEHSARARFAEFKRCRHLLTDYVQRGGTLNDLRFDMA